MALVLFVLLITSAASYKPAAPIKCGRNEFVVPCRTVCPPQNCESAYTTYTCDPKPKCIPGCDCIEYYLRDVNKNCIFNGTCPPPPSKSPDDQLLPENPANETSFHSNVLSIGDQSENRTTNTSSKKSSVRISTDNGKGACTYNRCTPTCSIPNPQNCPQYSNPCNCTPGTIISDEGGNCVQRQECQEYANCKGDYNASYTDCPIACPSTCAQPNAAYGNTQCGKLGCECNLGYLLNEINGSCIKPEDCPGGNVCGANETFISCFNKCPTSYYCPADDSRAIHICPPLYPCPSGCGCQRNYRRISVDDNRCIHASNCPPVNCTRPNEEWNPCPESCFSDYCSDRNRVTRPGSCVSSGIVCQPQCVCKQGFYRNGTDACVTAKECPPDN